MLAGVREQMGDRKRRLFAVACWRRLIGLLPDHLTDPRSHRAVDVAERYAGGMASEEERWWAEEEAFEAYIQMRESRLAGEPVMVWSRPAELLMQSAALSVSRGTYYAEDAVEYGR